MLNTWLTPENHFQGLFLQNIVVACGGDANTAYAYHFKCNIYTEKNNQKKLPQTNKQTPWKEYEVCTFFFFLDPGLKNLSVTAMIHIKQN